MLKSLGGPEFSRGDLVQYGRAVVRHWIVLLFAVGLSVLGGIQTVFNLMLPGWVWLGAVFFFLSLAQFLAFLDVRRENDRLRHVRDVGAALARLAKYRHELISVQNEQIADDVARGSWEQRYKDLRNQVALYIENQISEAEGLLFQRLGLFPEYIGGGNLNERHRWMRGWVARDHRWIEEMVKDYARQRKIAVVLSPDAQEVAGT
jgi:hypothetical protein